MPSIDKNGKIAIVICSIEGDKTVYIDSDKALFSDRDNHTPSDQRQSKCPYAVLAFSDGIIPSSAIPDNATALFKTDPVRKSSRLPFQNHFTSYYSRAPPGPVLL